MDYTPRGTDYELFDSLIVTPDRDDAPSWHFGKYVHSTMTRETLRQSEEGRAALIANLPLPSRGHPHERSSDTAPFVMWDGEGITYEQGKPQSYVLFGSSLGHEISARELHTVDCLTLIIEAEQDCPHALHVGFAFKYDAEMILRDLTLRHWHVLKRTGSVRYRGFHVTYHPGRVFRVTRKIDGQRYTATIYDVWGFFQSSFSKALRAWLDDDEVAEIDRIDTGKAARGTFTYEQLDTFIRPYWQAELRLGVLLCNRLRERMVTADLCPREWHGAGALATTLYRRHNTREHLARTERDRHDKDKDVAELPKEVNDAARYAYAGGRFELFKLGHTERTVYQYDINSAYPSAIAQLPSLRNAQWTHHVSPTFDHRVFAVWRIEYDGWSLEQVSKPGPLFQRDRHGRVSYPHNVSGWYWTPEATIVCQSPHTYIAECWVLEHNDEYPFLWVDELYRERKRRKANGDPSEKAQKLALNSLYGKQAQRLGYRQGEALPRFHQLEWAGWVTSMTRAKLYAAMRQAGRGLIAVETDAVFSLTPLDVDVSAELGAWDMTVHTWLTYLQSGTYWSDHGAKYRGFDHDSISHDDAMRWLRRGDWTQPLEGTTTRFVGAGRGLGTPLHRCWVTESRDMMPGRSGKRMHVQEACRLCIDRVSAAETMHPLLTVTRGGASWPHSLPWLDDDAPGLEWQELVEVEGWDAFDD